MQYTPRDLRAARLFAIILFSFAVALIVAGGIIFVSQPTGAGQSALGNTPEQKKLIKVKSSLPPGVGVAACGLTLGCLGAALAYKVRELVRTGGIEPTDLPKATP